MVLRKDLLVIFLLIAVAPFCVFIHFEPIGDFWPFFIASSAVAICTIITLGIKNYQQKGLMVSPFVGYLVGFFVILCLLAWVQKASLYDQAVLWVYSAIVILTALLAVQLSQKNNVQYYDYLAFILVVGGLVESFGAIAIQYGLAGIDYWMVPQSGRLIGFIAQSNQLAIYMMVAFLATGYLALRNSLPLIILLIISALFGFVLLGSGSRAVLVYLIIAIFITVFCLIKTKDKAYLKFFVCLVALGIGALIYYYFPVIISWFVSDSKHVVASNVAGSFYRSTASESFRLSEISKAFAMLKEAPLIGVGFGNYAVQGFWLGVNDSGYTVSGDLPLHSHNLLVQIMAEFGLIGLLLLLGLLGYIAVRFWRSSKTLQWWLVLTIFLVYFTNSMLEYVMWRMHFVPLLLLVLVPLLSNAIKWSIPRLVTSVIWVVIAGVFIVIADSSLKTYAKSFLYHAEFVTLDSGDYAQYQSATRDLLWGREVQLAEFAKLSSNINDLNHQQQITDQILGWRPFAPVIANKIQLLLLSGQIGDLAKYSQALAHAYPTMIPDVCTYFEEFSAIPNRRGLRIVKEGLDCRKFVSPQTNSVDDRQ